MRFTRKTVTGAGCPVGGGIGLVEVVGRGGEPDFGEFDRGPGAPAGKGDRG